MLLSYCFWSPFGPQGSATVFFFFVCACSSQLAASYKIRTTSGRNQAEVLTCCFTNKRRRPHSPDQSFVEHYANKMSSC